MYKKRENRLDEILNYVCLNNYASITDMKDHFRVSASAIKRDLDYLEKEGCVKRVPGGVVSVLNENRMSTPYESREHKNEEEKILIGEAAARFVQDGDIIFIASGSTCFNMYKSITSKDVVVFTNSLAIASHQNKNIKRTFILGGEIDQSAGVIRGPISIDSLNNINPNKIFFSSVGLNENYEILRNIESDLIFTKALFNKKCYSFYLVDSSKFNKIGLFSFGDISKVNTVITSKSISEESKKVITSANCNLILV